MNNDTTRTTGPSPTYAFTPGEFDTIYCSRPHISKPNGWKMYLHGYGTAYATVIGLMDDAKPPCWFHRVMVKWILGIVWVKEF